MSQRVGRTRNAASWRDCEYLKWPGSITAAGTTALARAAPTNKCPRRLSKFGLASEEIVPTNPTNPVPPLISSEAWNKWKGGMMIPSLWNYQFAHYIFCKLQQ